MNVFPDALAIAVVAYVYAEILTEPTEILSWWKTLLGKLFLPATRMREKYSLEEDAYADGLVDYEWIYKPLVGCFKCVAGQMALWWYVVVCWMDEWEFYRLDYHVALICSTILISIIIKHLHEWMKRKM